MCDIKNCRGCEYQGMTRNTKKYTRIQVYLHAIGSVILLGGMFYMFAMMIWVLGGQGNLGY